MTWDEVERAHRAVLEAVAADLVAAGRPRGATRRYERLLKSEPEQEGRHRSLMRAYAQSGERALALLQFPRVPDPAARRTGRRPERGDAAALRVAAARPW